MKILVTGATGLVGRRLVRALVARGEEVTALSRSAARAGAQLGVAAHSWDPLAGPPPAAALAGVDGVVHLAGESVAAGRWTAARKRAIADSRIVGTRHLVDGLRAASPKPRVLVSASAVGYYGDRDPGTAMSEKDGPGTGFLAEVVKAWEAEAARARDAGLRVVMVRFGVVLATEGGALAKMLGPFRAGLGGRLGTGAQAFPWVHLDDAVALLLHALDREEVTGPMNGVAPSAIDNAAFTRALGAALHRPAALPVPAFALRLLFGEMASVLLGGQRVEPAVAERTGYRFLHPDLDGALADLFAPG